MFPAGTTAEAVGADGTRTPLGSMTVRATERTVGDNSPQAMPGELPARSAYTYAVELSIDEAERVGATGVEFNQPVAFYTDNFTGAGVGEFVPVGIFDRTIGEWVAQDDGLVDRNSRPRPPRASRSLTSTAPASPGSRPTTTSWASTRPSSVPWPSDMTRATHCGGCGSATSAPAI